MMVLAPFRAGAQNMHDVFKSMPDSVLPLLTKNDKLDHLDYFDSHVVTDVKDRFGTPTRLLALTDDYALLRTGERTDVAFKLLNCTNGSRVICQLSTCEVDSMPDTTVRFYTTHWQPLDKSRYLNIDATNDFVELRFSAASTELTATTRRTTLRPEGTTPVSSSTPVATATWRWTGERFEK